MNEQQYFITFVDDYSRYNYLYLIHEKSQSLTIFKSFKVEVELQLGKKDKVIKSDCGGEYYGRYDGSGEQQCEIVSQYTMPSKPSMNESHFGEKFKDYRCQLKHLTKPLMNFELAKSQASNTFR
ncbi:hypothetical protein CR513_47937, partial [Mucuna pruriens]